MQGRDARFDGWFFTAVRTTGIYCRPSCPAITPLRRNVTFFPSAAAAQRAGFRACKRCRPDASPGSPDWDVRGDLAGRALRLIGDGVVDRDGVPGLARRLGYSERQVNRVLVAEVGAGPVALARAQRAQTARVLLETTDVAVTDIAFAAGFASVRQFNDTVRAVFATTPSALRAARRGNAVTPGSIALRLPYRAADGPRRDAGLPRRPSDRRRRGPGRGHLLAGAAGAGRPGSREPVTGRRRCAVHGATDRPARPGRRRRARAPTARPRCRPGRCRRRARRRPQPGRTRRANGPGCAPPARSTVSRWPCARSSGSRCRYAAREPCSAGSSPPTARSPSTASRGCCSRRRPSSRRPIPTTLPMPKARATALHALARAVADGDLTLDAAVDRDRERATLLAVPGIGPWTADYLRMRALGRPRRPARHRPGCAHGGDRASASTSPGRASSGRRGARTPATTSGPHCTDSPATEGVL